MPNHVVKFIVPAVLALAAAAAQGQVPARNGDGIVRKTILDRSNQLMSAMDRQDRAALERLTAPSFALRALGGDPANVTSRAEWIDNAMARRWRHNGYENVHVLVRGDQAVMLSTLNFSPPASGLKPQVKTASALVDIWQMQEGEWKAVGRYAGRWEVFQWFDRAVGFLVGGAMFGVAGWIFGRRKVRRPIP